MFNIASESLNGERTLLVDIDGKPMEWYSEAEAQNQIECFSRTAWFGITKPPTNFRWIILFA